MIKEGETIPNVELKVMGAEGPESVMTDDLLKGKKVVMFAVPGAFTPGCSNTHMPGFVINADKILAKGVDSIVCTAVNDVFVMDAWGKNQNADAMIMAADGNGNLCKALGMELDLSGFGLGDYRSQRYAMVINDGVVETLHLDGTGIDKSSAESILEVL